MRLPVQHWKNEMIELEDLIAAVIWLLLGLSFGNYAADQATLRDCATKGQAGMLGGGTITCEVKKETK